MKHLSEEELIEHYYSNDESCGLHLDECAPCAEKYAALAQDLDDLQSAPPLRDEAYGERVWQAIAPSLAAYKSPRKSWLRLEPWRSLSYAAACALMLAAAFVGGRLFEQKKTPPQVASAPHPAPPTAQANGAGGVQSNEAQNKPRVIVVVLSDHLERSERLLVELKHADAESDDLTPALKEEARSLLAANTTCLEEARKMNDPELDQALKRLGRVLDEVASQKGELDGATLTRLQNEMESDHLLFEVRVLHSSIPASHEGNKKKYRGGTI